jgi:hypothetical protein
MTVIMLCPKESSFTISGPSREIGSPEYVTMERQTKHEVICSLRATSSGDHREYHETAFSGSDIVAFLSQRANCF